MFLSGTLKMVRYSFISRWLPEEKDLLVFSGAICQVKDLIINIYLVTSC